MTLTEEELESSVYMTLNAVPVSDEAHALVTFVLTETAKAVGSTTKTTKKLTAAVGAIVADLMRAAKLDSKRYSYRPMAASSLSDHRLGYYVVKRAFDEMRSAKLVLMVPGFADGSGRGWATRFRATRKLLIKATTLGVERNDWSAHFKSLPRPKALAIPVVLKTSSKMVRGKKRPGTPIPIDLSRRPAMDRAADVNKLNAYFADVLIEPPEWHYAFQRVFNEGDKPSAAWKSGGRLIAIGTSYQQVKSEERGKLRLNGEPVVEIDIRASHLTILHARLKLPFDPATSDPYDIPDLPREVAKAWVTMTLGHDKFQMKWSTKNKQKYKQRCGSDLQKDYPVRATREKVLDSLPVLKDWETCSVRWGELQFLESQAVICAVGTLAFTHNVPALPVHDSIIVPESARSVAEDVLTRCFERWVGVKPYLTVKAAAAPSHS